MRKIISIKADNDYNLYAEFNDGEHIKRNVADLLNKPIFSSLKDLDIFKSVYLSFGAPTWKDKQGNEIDICPDKFFITGERISKSDYNNTMLN